MSILEGCSIDERNMVRAAPISWDDIIHELNITGGLIAREKMTDGIGWWSQSVF